MSVLSGEDHLDKMGVQVNNQQLEAIFDELIKKTKTQPSLGLEEAKEVICQILDINNKMKE